MNDYINKKIYLEQMMGQYAQKDIVVAFSGGVDSCLLLKLSCKAAEETGRKVYGITVQTKLHPAGELKEAENMCREIGAKHVAIHIDELKDAGILDNPVERCYLCKRYLFLKVLEQAAILQTDVVIEGTNEDDLHVYRPGIRALRELGIVSPLAQAGMAKAEVRRMAAEWNLRAAGKPSVPCLATRFPYGTALTYEKMRLVEKGEAYLKTFGFNNVRIRVHGNIARLEVDEGEFAKVMQYKSEIISYLKELGYIYITLDLEGFRSGSMDTGLVPLMM